MATWVKGPAELPMRHRALVELPLIATLCTQGRAGPMLSAVWYEWTGGGISCTIPPDGVIARNIKRQPRVALLVAGADRPYCGIEYRGEATSGDDYLPVLTRLAIRYLGARAGAEYLQGHPANLHLRMEHGRFRLWDDAS
jgi:hypothetical protein